MNNDLISRSALEKEIFGPGSYDTYEELLDAVRKAIDNAPAVDAIVNTIEVRPKGKWILVNPLQSDDGGAYMCSNCKTGDYGIERYEFCPYCGADMRGTDPIIEAIQENNAKYDERPNIDFSRMTYDLGGGVNDH